MRALFSLCLFSLFLWLLMPGALLQAQGQAQSQSAQSATALVPFRVEGGEIRASLTGAAGNAARGRAIVLNRNEGACLLCHGVPPADLPQGQPFMGDLAPPLAGSGARLTEGQLRLRMVDSTRINPQSIMPAYYRIDGLNQVAAAYRGKPVLSAEQIEDVVAYLRQLK